MAALEPQLDKGCHRANASLVPPRSGGSSDPLPTYRIEKLSRVHFLELLVCRGALQRVPVRLSSGISWTWEADRPCASSVELATARNIQARAWRSLSHLSVQASRRRDLFSSADFRGSDPNLRTVLCMTSKGEQTRALLFSRAHRLNTLPITPTIRQPARVSSFGFPTISRTSTRKSGETIGGHKIFLDIRTH